MTAFHPVRPQPTHCGRLATVLSNHPCTLASHLDAITMYQASHGFTAKVETLGNDKGR